jgi:serine phosphatase RsbU (regulator of sigma subunit)/anti-sigma regulatory factor (Ser/Thr protein kinase)
MRTRPDVPRTALMAPVTATPSKGGDVVTTRTPSRRIPQLRVPNRAERRDRRAARQAELEAIAASAQTDTPAIDIAPNDPLLAYLRSSPEPVSIDQLNLGSPGVQALRDAGVKLVVPLVAQGELIGLLNLGERLSEQEYSADDRKLLEHLAGQAAPALRVAQLVREQQAEARRRERYEQEMRVAQLIQQHLLPKQLPSKAGWEVNAFYRPAREVGGDFYDFIDLPDGRLAILVADVTDKGVPAALVMASTRSVLRSSAQRLIEPGAVLERVNDIVAQDMPPNMFVTCLYGVLEPATGTFRFANAGHNLPCVQTEGGAVEVRATGMPLGLLPGMTYEENEVVVGAGRTLLLYSDALPEAHAPDGQMFGFPKLVEVTGTSGDEVIDHLLTELHRFTGQGWEQEDDITIVSLTRGAHERDGLIGANDEPGRRLATFTIPSEPGNEREVMGRVADAVHGLGIEDDRLDRLKTAVSEATMNAIEHGNQNRSDLLVEIRVFASEHALVVRITDGGGGSQVADSLEEPDLEAKLRGEQSPRGWGLFLIKNMVDEMAVFEDEEHHTVDLLLRMDGEAHE